MKSFEQLDFENFQKHLREKEQKGIIDVEWTYPLSDDDLMDCIQEIISSSIENDFYTEEEILQFSHPTSILEQFDDLKKDYEEGLFFATINQNGKITYHHY